MSTFLLPKTIIKQVDKFRKHCLWRGSDDNNRKPPRTAWPMVYVPKDEGGLGVLNLRTHNECLLLKHLHKIYNHQDIPWVQLVWHLYYTNDRLPKLSANFRGSLWWRDLLKFLDSFKGMATVSVKDGKSSYLWLDLWNGRLLLQDYLELNSFGKNQFILVNVPKNIPVLHSLFHLPLSSKAYEQLQELQILFNNTHLIQDPNQWTYLWGSSIFSSRKAYRVLIGHHKIPPAFSWFWKSVCQNKHKFSF